MKKPFLFLAFLLPLCLQAKSTFPYTKNYKATKQFWMEITKPEVLYNHIRIQEGKTLTGCIQLESVLNIFFIDSSRYHATHEEFQSHIDNGDLEEFTKPESKPKTVTGPILR